MKLDELFKATPYASLQGIEGLEIRNIVFHSNLVREGDVFFAIPGVNSDGHDFINDAVSAGAIAVIGERDIDTLPVPYFKVPDARTALANFSAQFYGHPYLNHSIVGITGTNGKTTTAHMIRHIIEYVSESCALFGTVERYINGQTYASNMTTYDAVQMQKWLKESLDKNVVMEVSSHGLAQKRVEAIRFDYAVFTNLSHEHLDYHRTMDDYFHSKAKLFSLLKDSGEGIINTHNSWGRELAQKLKKSGTPFSSFGQGANDTLQLLEVSHELNPVFRVREDKHIQTFKLPMPGFYNIWNALAAILVARRRGISFSLIAEALASFPGVPGRLEIHQHPNNALFVIDYAHTPAGLVQCLKAVKSAFKPRRLIHIFGFRGNRDNSKWEGMYKISKNISDTTILTLDDLNGVPLETMLDQYKQLGQAKTTCVIPDRTLAIRHAWNQVQSGDCVIVTGKGPEYYQMSFNLPVHSDRETISYLQNQD